MIFILLCYIFIYIIYIYVYYIYIYVVWQKDTRSLAWFGETHHLLIGCLYLYTLTDKGSNRNIFIETLFVFSLNSIYIYIYIHISYIYIFIIIIYIYIYLNKNANFKCVTWNIWIKNIHNLFKTTNISLLFRSFVNA